MTSIVIVSQPAGSNYVQVTTWLGQLPCRALGCVANIVDGTYSILDGKWMAILIISYTSRRIHTPAVQYLVVVPVVPVYNMHPNIYILAPPLDRYPIGFFDVLPGEFGHPIPLDLQQVVCNWGLCIWACDRRSLRPGVVLVQHLWHASATVLLYIFISIYYLDPRPSTGSSKLNPNVLLIIIGCFLGVLDGIVIIGTVTSFLWISATPSLLIGALLGPGMASANAAVSACGEPMGRPSQINISVSSVSPKVSANFTGRGLIWGVQLAPLGNTAPWEGWP